MILYQNCPLCKSSNLAGYAIDVKRMGPHISRVICKKCKIIFANPMADEDELLKFYRFYYDKGNFKLLEYKKNLSHLMKTKPKEYNILNGKFIYQYVSKGNILDIGAGIGSTLHLVDSPEFNLYATDFDQDALEFIHKEFKSKVNTFKGDLVNAAYPNEFFDYIIFNHVIEHTLNPDAYLKEIFRILKKGGIVYIGTPDIHSKIYKLYRFLMFISGRIPDIVDGIEHTFLFSTSTLTNLVTKHGFKVITHRKVSVNDSISNLFKLKLDLKKLVARIIQTFIPVNQELICQKS
jgi:2-polyprenyl-3-methyl-5-hydroxy-6-metoxy-1,4-benzoquinol methylase